MERVSGVALAGYSHQRVLVAVLTHTFSRLSAALLFPAPQCFYALAIHFQLGHVALGVFRKGDCLRAHLVILSLLAYTSCEEFGPVPNASRDLLFPPDLHQFSSWEVRW